jgi:DNA-binding NarL/FixJ family response regulator
MIDVVIADEQDIYRIGMAEVLAEVGDVCVVGQPQSPEQLFNTLKTEHPHVLLLSASFLPAIFRIQQTLKRRHTALLVLAEENDGIAYAQRLRAHGIVHRSMDVPVIVDAMRRVARASCLFSTAALTRGPAPPKLPDGERHHSHSRLSAQRQLTVTVRSPQSDFVRSASSFLFGFDGFCACVGRTRRSNFMLRVVSICPLLGPSS